MDDAREAADRLEALIEAAGSVVAFTGAGLSTECGVPDFRSPGSPWLTNMPIDFSDFLRDPAARAESWRRKFAMDDVYRDVAPGRGHRALAALAARGKIGAIITQNIDNLHQLSGVPDETLIELHGNGSYARCLSCGMRHELAETRRAFEASGEAPSCACGGIVKSATISFGQAMPVEAMRRAQAATLACDLFIAIGSSLVVHPAAGFPALARQNGAKLAIVNREPTPLDSRADLVIRGDIGDALERYVAPANQAHFR
ncbi:MAG: Sir2 family NAD-dependent protein deacetylase [Methylobacteriaceae bacterium]|nr:Sir2 family NAD-dependent protein deacetylase [Methylobacteriaceae bacterium]